MLKSFVLIALRNIQKYKTFTAVNVIGFVIALTSCIFITLFVLDELNHDQFHKNAAQIYRVRQKIELFGFSPSTSWLLAEKLVTDFPEIKAAARIQSMNDPIHFKSGEQLIKESHYLFADNSIFDIFSFPLESGDSKHALSAPHSVVINQEMALKYFGTQNPLGQVLRVNIRSKWYDLQVTGVLEDIPANSDFNVDFMFSLSVLYAMHDLPGRQASEPHPMETWRQVSSFTYILLQENCSVSDLEAKVSDYFQKNLPDSYIKSLKFEPLSAIHLYQIDQDGNQKPGSMIYIYLFSAIGTLILLVAGINFVILSTANASVRAKEIGMRKVVGAERKDLIKQFLTESNLMAFMALPPALLVVELLLPWVNSVLNKQLDANDFQWWQILFILFGLTLVIGLSSGGYVALYLSALQPIHLQKKSFVGNFRSGLRKTLIIIQFTIFVALLVSSLVIYQQMRFIQETNLGFDKEQLIAIDMGRIGFGKHLYAFKRDVQQNPGVVNISAGSTLPLTETAIVFQETSLPESPDEKIHYHAGYVDYDFFKTLNARILEGRVFAPDFSQDLSESVVLNQMAVRKFGLGNPVGTLIQLQNGPGRVIGVVHDFVVSCYYETSPLVYLLKPGHPTIGTMIIRLKPDNISATLKYLENKWYEYAPDAVFGFQFVDQELNQQYEKDIRFSKIITAFTLLAIIIASLGLFGLAWFMIKLRTKELGVRKILGASTGNLIFLQFREIIYLVIIGNAIAWPIAWYAMNQWLQNFAYRIEISWWVFVLAGGLAMLIAFVTVSWQALRAAMANPVESLRCE